MHGLLNVKFVAQSSCCQIMACSSSINKLETKGSKSVSKIFIADFTHKYKRLFVKKKYSTLRICHMLQVETVFPYIIKMEVNLTE